MDDKFVPVERDKVYQAKNTADHSGTALVTVEPEWIFVRTSRETLWIQLVELVEQVGVASEQLEQPEQRVGRSNQGSFEEYMC